MDMSDFYQGAPQPNPYGDPKPAPQPAPSGFVQTGFAQTPKTTAYNAADYTAAAPASASHEPQQTPPAYGVPAEQQATSGYASPDVLQAPAYGAGAAQGTGAYEAAQQAPAQPAPAEAAAYPAAYAPAYLTGAQKAAFFFIGAGLLVPGILATSMMNVGRPYRSEATKFAVIGCIAVIALCVLLQVAGCALVLASIPSASSTARGAL